MNNSRIQLRVNSSAGFTLVEVIVTILVIAILAGVATKQLSTSLTTAKYEATKAELDQLAAAIVGNPDTYSMGTRADFGYVGDIGAIPVSLNNLVTNPGSYTTWDGPYMSTGGDTTAYKTDGWGTAYQIVSTSVRSTGSGSNIDRPFASSSSALTSNTISGTIIDASGTIPGSTYKDSLWVLCTYPNGSGSTTTSSSHPDKFGSFSISGVPMGCRTVRIVYISTNDTMSYAITVYPGKTATMQVRFPDDLF